MEEMTFFTLVILIFSCASGVYGVEYLEYHEQFNDSNILSRGWHWEWATPSWNVTNGELNWQQSNLTIWQEYNRNLPMLLRDAPKLSEGLATEVTVRMSDIGGGGSQVGIFWYYNRQNYYKIVVENLTAMGLNVVFLREEADATHTMHYSIPMHDIHDLRIAVEGDEVRGYYRQHGETTWQSAGAFPLNVKSLPLQVGLSTHHGGAYVQADDFKIFSQRPTKPVAVFDAITDDNPKGCNGVVPLTVHCDARMSAGTNLSYSWDFGDGGTSLSSAPSYTYNSPGTYEITLTASNSNGSDTFKERVHVLPGSNDSNLILDMQCEDLSGVTAHDDSRYDNWGVMNQGVVQVGGFEGKALRFNGGHSNVIVSISPELRLGYAEFSISAWVKWGGTPGSGGGRILTKTHYTSEEMFSLYAHADRKLRFLVKTSNGTVTMTSSSAIPDDGQFHHVAAVYDKSISQMRTYIDGTLRGTKTQSGNVVNNNRPLQIGANLNVADSGFKGDLDTVQLYKRALSSSEISAMADTQNGQIPNASFTSSIAYLDVSADAGSSQDSDGTIVSYDWDFGDGSTADGVTASHSYSSPGTYTITLTVTDNDGLSDSATQSVNAVLPPDPIEMTVYQAEDSSDSSDSKYRTDGSWWTGSGFQDMFRSPSSYVEWNYVYRETAESVELHLTYTNGDAVNRSCSIIVNEVTVGTVQFAPTGGWSTIGIETIDVNVSNGFNTIRIQGNNPEGGPDFDKMELASGGDPDPDPEPEPVTVYQAEDYTAKSDSYDRTDGDWWTGTGFQDMFRAPDSFIEWNNVYSDSSQTVYLDLTYTNGDGVNRSCSVIVNGVDVGTVLFAPTGSWSTVVVESISVALQPGFNTVRIQGNNPEGGPDFDKMELASGGDPDPDPEPEPVTVYQAEDYTDKLDSYDRTDGDWWTGTGFQDMFRSPDSYVEWNNVYAENAGTVTLSLTYTNGHSYDRACSVIVNGNTAGTVNFSPTGSWSIVGTEYITADLNSGYNTIRVQAASENGGPDFDKLEVFFDIAGAPVPSSKIGTPVSTDVSVTTEMSPSAGGGCNIGMGKDASCFILMLPLLIGYLGRLRRNRLSVISIGHGGKHEQEK